VLLYVIIQFFLKGFEQMEAKLKHPLYSVWASMKNRCLCKTNKYWSYYGGRGITICDQWLGKDGFAQFVNDMGPRPDGYSLDRENNNAGYSPENCRWATRSEQQLNRRNTIILTIEGRQYFQEKLAKQSGLKADTIKERAAKGLSFAEIVDPKKRKNTIGLLLGGKANGERNKAKTHCKYGHEYTPENTIRNGKDGLGRACKKCHAIRQAEYTKQKKKA
jgi:hypothetical protein